MKYRKGLVYFIDVLGTKNTDFDELYKIANIFHTELENTQNRHNPRSVGDRHIIGFSDCAYIIYSLKDEYLNDEDIRLEYIYTSLYNTAIMMAIFANSNFLCRGGICYDDVYYEKNRDIIFGPAVNLSYKLESEYAIAPRVLLSDDLAQDVVLFDKKVKDKSPLASQNGNILMKDPSDGKYFLNYLNIFYQHEEVGAGSCNLKLKYIYDLSIAKSTSTITSLENSLNKCEEDGKTAIENIINKHKWQIWYLKQAMTELNSAPPPLSEQELLSCFKSSTAG
jgi:hypothetical protein